MKLNGFIRFQTRNPRPWLHVRSVILAYQQLKTQSRIARPVGLLHSQIHEMNRTKDRDPDTRWGQFDWNTILFNEFHGHRSTERNSLADHDFMHGWPHCFEHVHPVDSTQFSLPHQSVLPQRINCVLIYRRLRVPMWVTMPDTLYPCFSLGKFWDLSFGDGSPIPMVDDMP